jgi:hypothetical protein
MKSGVAGTNGQLQLARTSDGATITNFITDGANGIINSVAATVIQVNTAEKMRIHSDGNVGVGTAGPACAINASFKVLEVSSSAGSAVRCTDTASSTNIEISAGSGSTYVWNGTNTQMQFGTNNTSRMTIAAAGAVTITDNLVFSTAGKGVYLGVTSATAANLLDDYEEGDFTPAFTYATAGNQSFAYGAQVGKYTKIGRMVHYGIQITTTTHTYSTAAGTLTITGLPFAASGAINQPGSIAPFSGITDFIGGRTVLSVRPFAGNTSLILSAYGSNLNSNSLSIASTTTGTNIDLYISGSYLV